MIGILGAVLLLAATSAPTGGAVDYAGDAKALDQLISDNYAYEDHWPGGTLPMSKELQAERDAVHDDDGLLHYAEHRIASLADHHAITGSSFRDSWALVPTYSDLWIEVRDGRFFVTSVRPESPAADAGIRDGDELVSIGGKPAQQAVSDYWARLGLQTTVERLSNGARVLAAGRRDRPRQLGLVRGGKLNHYELPSLYSVQRPDQPAVSISREGSRTVILVHNSLGDQGTIEAFDKAMATIGDGSPVVIDLRDTPSGGNTSVARAMMGWFVTHPTSYQVHRLPSEERETGIARQWIEQVLPRTGKYHRGPLEVRVGRWTGSMGEGLAIGFGAIGAKVCGGPMAGLKGAVYDFTLPSSGLTVKFPAERLYTVKGMPREQFVPAPC